MSGSFSAGPSESTIRSIVKAVTRRMLGPVESQLTTPFRIGSAVVLCVVFRSSRPARDCGTLRSISLRRRAGKALSDKLSRREREVAKLLVAGYSNVNIAALCGLSPNTIRTFMRRLYAKLGVFNRADLVRELVRRPLA